MVSEDFGFTSIAWVYSGRRGVHCWVCDPKAKMLTLDLRSAVAEYINVERKKQQGDAISFLQLPRTLHPALGYVHIDFFACTLLIRAKQAHL